jgi:hypothetical protein
LILIVINPVSIAVKRATLAVHLGFARRPGALILIVIYAVSIAVKRAALAVYLYPSRRPGALICVVIYTIPITVKLATLAVYLYPSRRPGALIRIIIYTIPIAVFRDDGRWRNNLLFTAKGKAESCGIKEIAAGIRQDMPYVGTECYVIS